MHRMNAFGEALRAYIEHGIKRGRWTSERQFALLVGTNTANMTGILKHGRFPSVKALREYLEKSNADPAEAARLVSLLSYEKAKLNEEMAPYLKDVEDKLAASREIIRWLRTLIKSGKTLPLPKDLEDSIEAL